MLALLGGLAILAYGNSIRSSTNLDRVIPINDPFNNPYDPMSTNMGGTFHGGTGYDPLKVGKKEPNTTYFKSQTPGAETLNPAQHTRLHPLFSKERQQARIDYALYEDDRYLTPEWKAGYNERPQPIEYPKSISR